MKLPRNNKKGAFTLIELMVVILIIAVLAAMIVPRLMSRADDAKEAKALADLENLSKVVDLYRLDVGSYPTAEEGLEGLLESNAQGWRGPYLNNLPPDPWGNAYIYDFPGPYDDSYVLYSSGPDGQIDTEDDIYSSRM